MSISMTAKKPFTNPRVSGPRPDGSVLPDDTFTTDWLHAKELQRLGLAEADKPGELDVEPSEGLAPHNQISVLSIGEINARRAKARGDKPATGAAGQAVTGDALRSTDPAKGNAPIAPAKA